MIKKILLSISSIITITALSASAEGLLSEDAAPGDDLDWSEPVYAQTIIPNASLIFDDVKDADWFYDDVSYITAAKLMKGYDNTTFAPYDKATEAMMITVLYRMAGSPEVSSDSEEWYAPAVKWGYMNSIIDNGANWQFTPDKPISRGIFVCMLAAYNENIGKDSSDGDASIFPDYRDFPEYAKSAAGWAGEKSIVTGRDSGVFDFYGEATRAELAAMLHRYIENH